VSGWGAASGTQIPAPLSCMKLHPSDTAAGRVTRDYSRTPAATKSSKPVKQFPIQRCTRSHVHRARVQQQAVETTLRGDCALRVRQLRQQNISPPAQRQQRRCDIQRFTARPVVSDELGFEHLQHVRVLGAAMPAICAAPHARTPAREVTYRFSRS
jgi:hypothetical protein